jgi:hypothetical protein
VEGNTSSLDHLEEIEIASATSRKRALCVMALTVISPLPHRSTTYVAVPKRSYTMKMLSAVLIALALLSMAAPVSAFDAKSFFEQQDRQSGN